MGFGEGLSWVKGICQKLETSADEYFEACTEYVNTTSEHIKQIYEEICEWEDPYEIEGEVCDLDLMHETIVKVSSESSVEPVNISEKTEDLSITSIPEDSDTVAVSRKSQALSPETACDVYDESLQTGAISCSNDSGENLKGSSDTFSLPEDSDTVAISRKSQALSPETACDVYDESLQTGAISCSNDAGENVKGSSDTFSLPEDSDTVAVSRKSQALSPETTCDVYDESLQTGAISCSNDSGENLKGSSDTFSLPEDSDTVGLSGESRAPSHETACHLDDEPLQTGAVSCSNDLVEKCKESSDTVTLLQGPTSSPEQDFAQLLESHCDAGSPAMTGHIPSVEAIDVSQDKMRSCINEREQQVGPNKFETPAKLCENDVGEASDIVEDLMSCTPKPLVQNAQSEEFEAIKVEDCGDFSLTEELALISHYANKNMSLKKKLKNLFISRRGRKAHKPINYIPEDDATRMQNEQCCSAFSVPSEDSLDPSSMPVSIESEWELL